MRCLAVLVLAALVAPAQRPENVRAKYEKQEVRIAMRDGVRLFTAIYRPREATGDFSRSPVPWCSDGMVSFGRMIREGHLDVVTDVVERFTGRKPRTLRELMLERRHTWPKGRTAG